MNKTANFTFTREHYIGDQRHPAGSQAPLDSALAEKLQKQGVGKIDNASTTAARTGTSDKKS